MRSYLLAITAASLALAPAPGADAPPFGRHVAPLLYKLGCSAGQCHGAFAGKGGLRLSLFASHAEADFQSLRDALGRRVHPANPEASLLLLKPSGSVEHGGGLRLPRGSFAYQ